MRIGKLSGHESRLGKTVHELEMPARTGGRIELMRRVLRIEQTQHEIRSLHLGVELAKTHPSRHREVLAQLDRHIAQVPLADEHDVKIPQPGAMQRRYGREQRLGVATAGPQRADDDEVHPSRALAAQRRLAEPVRVDAATVHAAILDGTQADDVAVDEARLHGGLHVVLDEQQLLPGCKWTEQSVLGDVAAIEADLACRTDQHASRAPKSVPREMTHDGRMRDPIQRESRMREALE